MGDYLGRDDVLALLIVLVIVGVVEVDVDGRGVKLEAVDEDVATNCLKRVGDGHRFQF